MNQSSAHRYEDKLLELAYGELPAAEARSVEAHVKGCARCSGALRDIQGVRRQMSQLAAEPAPDAGLESLLAYAQQTARRIQAGPEPKKGWRRLLFGVAGLASAAAVVVAVTTVTLRAKDEVPAPTAVFSEEAKAAAPVAPTQLPTYGQGQEQQQQQEQQQGQYGELDQVNTLPRSRPSPVTGTKVPIPKDKSGRVQEVDVVQGTESLRKAADALDTRQDFVPGRGTRPAVPSGASMSSSGLQRGKMAGPPAAPEPAPPEMMLGGRAADLDNAATDTRIAGKQRSPTRSAPAKKAANSDPDLFGSGGGFGEPKADRAAPAPTDDEAAEPAAAGSVAPQAPQEASKELAYSPPPPAASPAPVRPAPAPSTRLAEMAAAEAEETSLSLRKREEVQKKSKVAARPASALEWFTRANEARGTADEPLFLERAIDAGLSGSFRVDALQRLCLWFESKGEAIIRAEDFCTEWNAMASSTASRAAVNRVRAARMKLERSKAGSSLPSEPAAPADAVKKAHSF